VDHRGGSFGGLRILAKPVGTAQLLDCPEEFLGTTESDFSRLRQPPPV
jgi:hypothetical protein